MTEVGAEKGRQLRRSRSALRAASDKRLLGCQAEFKSKTADADEDYFPESNVLRGEREQANGCRRVVTVSGVESLKEQLTIYNSLMQVSLMLLYYKAM